jgi:hypothetical protein
MFKITFEKDDKINGKEIKAGETKSVSSSIRNEKIASGFAKDFIEEVVAEPKKSKREK